jgi:hypothetical protein
LFFDGCIAFAPWRSHFQPWWFAGVHSTLPTGGLN